MFVSSTSKLASLGLLLRNSLLHNRRVTAGGSKNMRGIQMQRDTNSRVGDYRGDVARINKNQEMLQMRIKISFYAFIYSTLLFQESGHQCLPMTTAGSIIGLDQAPLARSAAGK
jgi:hypothetical protein